MYKKFHSNYISVDYDKNKKPLFIGNFFKLNYVPSIKGFCMHYVNHDNNLHTPGREIIIEAKDSTNAIKASKLILASLILIDSYMFINDKIPEIKPFLNNKEENDEIEFYKNGMKDFCRPGILLACMIACKASFRRKYYYALFKYQLGCSLHSNAIVDLDPYHSPYYKLSPFIDDKIRMGNVITLFYSVIEELGLEIRASKKNPSFIKKNWNPIVKNELENRLKRSGIDINDEYYWNLRSTPTKIERYLRKQKKLSLLGKAQWAHGYTRDSKTKIVDAILLISWMRARVATHRLSKSNDLINSISIYDVDNANQLARWLLIEKLGFSKHFKKS
jgi:hypothetical protein